ncbi:unnamed protein product [Urochloa humidicola]
MTTKCLQPDTERYRAGEGQQAGESKVEEEARDLDPGTTEK